jgi:hypothetical protein
LLPRAPGIVFLLARPVNASLIRPKDRAITNPLNRDNLSHSSCDKIAGKKFSAKLF